ncbi:MAG TPA: hypothetical protein VF519_10380 [Mycobacteriales bacterium]
MKRTLTLKRETLAALEESDLRSVNGAAGTTPINACLGISFEFTCLDCITRRSCG